MPSLKDYHVDERKVWFTGGYWPKGVPHQIYDVKFAKLLPLYELIIKNAKQDHYFDNDIAYYVLGSYIERITLRKVDEYARKFGTYLYIQKGIRKGDVVAVSLPNSINYIVAFLGCQYIGAIVAGINHDYKPAELEHVLKVSQAKIFITLDSLLKLDELLKNPDLKITTIIKTNLLDFITATGEIFEKCKDFIPEIMKSDHILKSSDNEHILSLTDILRATEAKEIHTKIDPWKDPAIFFMTGGTTGLPKIAVDTHVNILGGVYAIQVWVGKSIIDLDLSKMLSIGIVPFYHLSGSVAILIASIIAGLKILIFPQSPTQEHLMETINHIDVPDGIMYSAAEVLYIKFNAFVDSIGGPEEFRKRYDFGKKIRYVGHGSGPLHDEVREKFESILNLKIKMGYGSSEAGPVSGSPYWGDDRRGTAGIPYPGFDWIIADPIDFDRGIICDGTPEKGNFGEEFSGEICIASASVFSGYIGEETNKEDNIKEWNGKRWLLTGDIGFMDKYGFVTITGRKKSLIKVSGHSVFPIEVENLISKNPMIEEVAVAGLPNKEWGETIKAWIVLKPHFREEKKNARDTIIKWCRENITKWKNPHFIEILDTLPRSGPGKIQYSQLIDIDLKRIKEGKDLNGEN